jgi:flavin-dependent dehydrogenase
MGNEPNLLISQVVMQNRRAGETLNGATAVTEWTSVALDHFGASDPFPGPGLISVGDAAAFIDPFTGSGMLMALESSKLAAETIARWLNSDRSAEADHLLESEYRRGYAQRFRSRLRLCSWLRRAASVPLFADGVIGVLGLSSYVVQRLARATRQDQSNPIA